MEALVIVIIVVCIYFIPSMVGQGRENGVGVFVLNLFLGWSFVGWVVALVWATQGKKKI